MGHSNVPRASAYGICTRPAMLSGGGGDVVCLLDRNPPVYWPGDTVMLTLRVDVRKGASVNLIAGTERAQK